MTGNFASNNSNNNGTYTVGYAFTVTSNFQVTAVHAAIFGSKVEIWSSAGTLLLSQAVTGPATTWTETTLTTPLQLLAGTTYRVTVYTAGATYYWNSTAPKTSSFATIGQTYEASGDGFPTSPDTGQWWLIDLRGNVGTSSSVPITPTTATFTNGVWSGNVTVTQAATAMHLHADDGLGQTGDSASFNVIGPPPAAPATPLLTAASDTGVSSSDDLTSLNNTAGKTLQFSVGSTIPGAVIALYANGIQIGQATATTTTTVVTTDGVTALADGTYAITARQTLAGGSQSVDSAGLNITIRTATPATPAAPILEAASDSGISNSDGITNINTPTFDVSVTTPYFRIYSGSGLVSASYASGSSVTLPAMSGWNVHLLCCRGGRSGAISLL